MNETNQIKKQKEKKRVVVVCPGRGSYTKESLGYLLPHRARLEFFFQSLDQQRMKEGFRPILELDSLPTFSPSIHTVSQNASTLIYACSYADYTAIDQNLYEIVAITGNSMGWYISLGLGGSLDWSGAYTLINTMGFLMHQDGIGGQVIYPLTKENWEKDPEKLKLIDHLLNEAQSTPLVEIHASIFLGGYIVFGANKPGVDWLLKKLPPVEHFPFQLIHHAAFHTPLLKEVANKAHSLITEKIFSAPKIPLIDGRGHIWHPYNTDVNELYQYTLGKQILSPYHFNTCIEVALKEFNPDHLFLLGPGNSLGAPVGQILVHLKWKGMQNKEKFSVQQKQNPFMINAHSILRDPKSAQTLNN